MTLLGMSLGALGGRDYCHQRHCQALGTFVAPYDRNRQRHYLRRI